MWNLSGGEFKLAETLHGFSGYSWHVTCTLYSTYLPSKVQWGGEDRRRSCFHLDRLPLQLLRYDRGRLGGSVVLPAAQIVTGLVLLGLCLWLCPGILNWGKNRLIKDSGLWSQTQILDKMWGWNFTFLHNPVHMYTDFFIFIQQLFSLPFVHKQTAFAKFCPGLTFVMSTGTANNLLSGSWLVLTAL